MVSQNIECLPLTREAFIRFIAPALQDVLDAQRMSLALNQSARERMERFLKEEPELSALHFYMWRGEPGTTIFGVPITSFEDASPLPLLSLRVSGNEIARAQLQA